MQTIPANCYLITMQRTYFGLYIDRVVELSLLKPDAAKHADTYC